jgi:O-antigen/teichoic acid export membrane protein
MSPETPNQALRLDVKKTLTRNTAWNYVGFAVNLVTNLFLFPYVVREIGNAAAGIWLILGSLTGYMGLLELGLVPSLAQSVAVYRSKGDTAGINRAASTALVLLLLLAMVPASLLAAVPWLVGLLKVPAPLLPRATIVFAIAIAGFAARMPLAAYQAVLLGTQRQDRCNQLWILIVSAKLVCSVSLLWLGFGLTAIVAMEALVHLSAGILQVRWARAEVPGLSTRWRLADRGEARSLVGFGTSLLAVTLCSLIVDQTDRLVIGAFLPVAMVTYYAAAWKLYMLAYSVPTTLVQAVTTLVGHLFGREDRRALQQLFLRMTKYTVALSWPLVLSLGFCASVLLEVWMGPEFARHSNVLQALVVAFAVTAHNHAGYSVLIGIRRMGPTVWQYSLPQAVLNLALSVWLVGKLGIFGVALGTMIPALALEYFLLRFVLAEVGLRWKDFFVHVVAPTAGPAIVAFAPLAAVFWRLGPHSLFLIPVAAACSVLYAAIFWFGSLARSERAELLTHVPYFNRVPAAAVEP